MKKLTSFLACLICLCFCTSPIFCNAAVPEIVIAVTETAFTALIAAANEKDENGVRKGIAGVARDFQSNLIEGSFLNPLTVNDDGLEFKIPNYEIITGQVMLHSDFGNDDEITYSDDTLIECTWLMSDMSSGWTSLEAVAKDEYSGQYYFSNALNFTITFKGGGVQRLVCKFRSNKYNNINHTQSFISTGTGYVDVYLYTGPVLEQKLYDNHYTTGVRMYFAPKNTIRYDLNPVYPSTGQFDNYYPSGYSAWGNSGNSINPRVRPSLEDIVLGRCYYLYGHTPAYTGSSTWSGVGVQLLDNLYCSFYTTNNNNIENLANNYWTEPYQQNYYIDNIYEGGTVINNDNGDTYINGAFAPAFDIDPDLPLADILGLLADLLPDFKLGLEPSLGLNIDDLFDRLFDFYANMPPIDMNFDPELDNDNYWDIELPALPDAGGGGSGDITVNVDITRPKIPYIDTSPQITLYIPTVTTTALPTGLITASKNFVELGVDITNAVGTTSLIVICGFVGVGVMFLFKDW